jgi:hypothetical protein
MMGRIDDRLKDPAVAAAFATKFLGEYLTPAFGARSKSETDLLVFASLVAAGAIDPAGPIYDTARALNITPARARNLLFNWQLRSTDPQADLRAGLIAALQHTRFATDGSLMSFGVESPILREEFRARLKRKGIFADASFSQELLRLPVPAFVDFLDELVDDDTKKALRAILVKGHQLPDTSFKAFATGVLQKLGEKVAGEAGEAVAGAIVKGAGDTVVKPAIERLTGFLTHLLGRDPAGAASLLSEADLALK